MNQRPTTALARKISAAFDFLTFVVAFCLLLGLLTVLLPPVLVPIAGIAGALVFYLIYDSLRSSSPRNAEALQTDRPGAERLGWILYACNVAWPVIYFLLVQKVYGGRVSGGAKMITFLRDEAAFIGLWFIPAFTVALLFLLVWAWWKKVRQKQQIAVALGLTLMTYPVVGVLFVIALFVMGAESGAGQWHLRQKIHGNDNRTYYLLHAPPQFNGSGNTVIARQMKHSPISVTVQILTPDYGSGSLKSILSQGSEDKDPKVRKLCKMLMQSKKGWGKERY